jgi:hypothetical protein
VLLGNGEYVEGEFRGIHHGQLMVSSVLFGVRQYDLTSEVMAVGLRRSPNLAARFEVRMLDGTVWLGESLELGWNEVVLSESSIGRCRLPIYDLREVRRGKR